MSAFDRLSQPELYAEEEEAAKGRKGKKKPAKIQRSNEGCRRTRVDCPRCRVEWGTAITGVEPYFYNFMMQGLKCYTCATCLLQFGCMSAVHRCPFCAGTFEYDPKDYHRKIKCGNASCGGKEFGFYEFHVSERVERELRDELRATQVGGSPAPAEGVHSIPTGRTGPSSGRPDPRESFSRLGCTHAGAALASERGPRVARSAFDDVLRREPRR